MSDGLLLPNGAAQQVQIRELQHQNFSIIFGQVYVALAAEEYRAAIADLRERKRRSKLKKGDEPTNLVISPPSTALIARTYAGHFAFEAHPDAMGWPRPTAEQPAP